VNRRTGLDSHIELRLGLLDLRVDLEVADGRTLALLGPNGSGKSTALRALAGLVPIDAGHITLDGQTLDDPATGAWVPPQHRPIGVVFQDYLLFPNLSALDNVAFGLRRAGAGKDAARAEARRWLERVGLSSHATNRPAHLSGGQAQRVALARALATQPRVLLLDEPLAALDAGARTQLRSDLRRHLATFPGVRILVTHDPVDAIALADHVVVLEAGRVVQTGTVADIAALPRSRYVADLVGVNLYRGRAHGTTVALDAGGALTIAEPTEGDVWALVHPSGVALYREPPSGSPRNTWGGTVLSVDGGRDRVRVRLAATPPVVAEVTAAAVQELRLEQGTPVWAAVKATEITVYPA
jgi:molybdate transport system ATP-binding protein